MLELTIKVFVWLAYGFWVWMLIDCLLNEEDKAERLAWCLVLLILNVLIAPFYYFRVYRFRKLQKNGKGA